jgi:hypothetical protein
MMHKDDQQNNVEAGSKNFRTLSDAIKYLRRLNISDRVLNRRSREWITLTEVSDLDLEHETEICRKGYGHMDRAKSEPSQEAFRAIRVGQRHGYTFLSHIDQK